MTLWRLWIAGQLEASIAAAALLAAAVLLRHRLSPGVRSAILLIALIRLVLPPWLRSPWSEALVDLPPIDDGRRLIAIALQSDPARYAAAAMTSVTIVLLLRVAWMLVSAERRWVSITDPGPDGMLEGIELRLSRNGEGPLAAGFTRKLIVLPPPVLQLERPALQAVLAHEVAHHERRDLLWIAIAETLKAIAWFNPLAHLTARALIASREDGSDDWAVRRTSNDPFAYAHALLQSSRIVADPPPLGVAGAHPMGKRFQRLLDSGAAREGRIGLIGAVIILLSAVAAIPAAHTPSVDQPGRERVVIVIRR